MESVYKPGSVEDSHSSGSPVTKRLKQPTREPRGPRVWGEPNAPLFGLAPGGVCLAALVADSAVRSYRTISPLPGIPKETRRYIFCGTFRRLAPPRHYLAPCPLEPGLSSLRANADSDCPTNSERSLTVGGELCQSSLS